MTSEDPTFVDMKSFQPGKNKNICYILMMRHSTKSRAAKI